MQIQCHLVNLLIDQSIPYHKLFNQFGSCQLFSSPDLHPQQLNNIEGLVVRSHTQVSKKLIKNTNIKLIASPSIGTDHVDVNYLAENKITFFNAPGCNARSVAEYNLFVLLNLLTKNKELTITKIGILGKGNTGTQTGNLLQQFGFDIIYQDPFKLQNQPYNNFSDCQAICLCVPLTYSPTPYPTYQLINKAFLRELAPNTVIINTSRGEIINQSDWATHSNKFIACFDVWPNEPTINKKLLAQTTIATPHIAGHAIEAKIRGTLQIAEQIADYLDQPFIAPEITLKKIDSIYNPFIETNLLKSNPEKFRALRKNHIRHELDQGQLKFLIDNHSHLE